MKIESIKIEFWILQFLIEPLFMYKFTSCIQILNFQQVGVGLDVARVDPLGTSFLIILRVSTTACIHSSSSFMKGSIFPHFKGVYFILLSVWHARKTHVNFFLAQRKTCMLFTCSVHGSHVTFMSYKEGSNPPCQHWRRLREILFLNFFGYICFAIEIEIKIEYQNKIKKIEFFFLKK